MRRKTTRNLFFGLGLLACGFLFFFGFLTPSSVAEFARWAFYRGRGSVASLRTTSGGSGNYRDAARCRANLRVIESAKRRAAGENGAATGHVSKEAVIEALGGKVPTCPSGGIYTVGPLLTLPRCSVGSCGTPNDDKDDHLITGH